MTQVLTTLGHLALGLSLYAGLLHATIGLQRPFDRTHLLFASFAVFSGLLGVWNALTYQTFDPVEMVAATRANVTLVILTHLSFMWFVADYTRVRPRGFLIAVSLLGVGLVCLNLLAPYGLQYGGPVHVERGTTPWGESFAIGVGPLSAAFPVAVVLTFITAVYEIAALTIAWRRWRRATTLLMLGGATLAVALSVQGVMVRLGLLDSVRLGVLGMHFLVIVFGVAYAVESHGRLARSERRFRSLVEQSPSGMLLCGPDGAVRESNPAHRRLWSDAPPVAVDDNLLLAPAVQSSGIAPELARAFAGEAVELPSAPHRLAAGPGGVRWMRWYAYPIRDEAGQPTEVVVGHEDITAQKRSEDAIRLIAAGVALSTGERFFHDLLGALAGVFGADCALIGVVDEADPDRVNTIAVRDRGVDVPNFSYSLTGTPCARVMEQDICAYFSGAREGFPDDALLVEMGIEAYLGTPLRDDCGRTLGIVCVMHREALAITEAAREILGIFAARAGAELRRLRAEQRTQQLAFYDYLTGLPNRAQLYARLGEEMDDARRTRGALALLMIDLDHFKTINDVLSHDTGDRVLKAVASRLEGVVAGSGFLARLGGDEFVVLIGGETSAVRARADECAAGILAALGQTLPLDGRALHVGASIGMALFPKDADSGSELLRRADMALYRSKGLGRGVVTCFAPELHHQASERLTLEEGLRRALAREEFELHFQPIVDAAGKPRGAEALLRWKHDTEGYIAPGRFIPVAEDSGIIHALGAWVLANACSRLVAWGEQGVDIGGRLAVNVSQVQFRRPDFVEGIHEVIVRCPWARNGLTIEITESAVQDLGPAGERLQALRDLGLKIALDDFGTGYSSLAHLRDLPIDTLKIDGAFIREIDEGERASRPLVESMFAIGRHMGLQVVAEGVETDSQRGVLAGMGCAYFQGFLFGRPMCEKDFLEWLQVRRRLVAS